MPELTERTAGQDTGAGRGLMLTTLALLAMGVVMVHSAVATVGQRGAWYARMDIRHMMFAVAAAMVVLVAWRINYRVLFGGGRLPLLAGCVLLISLACQVLVFVPGIGHEVGGHYRWIRIGPAKYSIGFQPSELVKLSLIVFLAAWLSRKTIDVRSFKKTFLPAALLVGACVALVIKQDFGTAVVIATAAIVTMLLAGVPWYYLASLVPLGAGGFFKFVVLDPRRWGRIAALIDPWSLSNPAAYQPRQSLLAILTGGWFGKGPGRGMLKLGFLPEDSTDFIFSVYCEEWGFVGAMLLMGLVVAWILFARKAALRASDGFGKLLAGSIGFVIALQAVLHIAVDVVVAPPTGMGMPFVSAGGTALLMLAGATAMIVSVAARGTRADVLVRTSVYTPASVPKPI